MSWYYNSDSGSINQVPDIVAAPELHLGLGWHGPFDTKQAAIDYYNSGKAANPGWKAPTGIAGTINNVIVQPATSAVTGDILGNVKVDQWFIRIGEILLGLILVGVGVAKLTGASNLISTAVKAKI